MAWFVYTAMAWLIYSAMAWFLFAHLPSPSDTRGRPLLLGIYPGPGSIRARGVASRRRGTRRRACSLMTQSRNDFPNNAVTRCSPQPFQGARAGLVCVCGTCVPCMACVCARGERTHTQAITRGPGVARTAATRTRGSICVHRLNPRGSSESRDRAAGRPSEPKNSGEQSLVQQSQRRRG